MWRFDLELLPLQSLRKIELGKKEEVSSPRRQRHIAQHGNRKDNFTITILAIQPPELRCRSITIDTFRCLIPVKRSMCAVHLVKCIYKAVQKGRIIFCDFYIILFLNYTLHFLSFLEFISFLN